MEKNFDAAACEAAIYEKWESSGAFKAGANAKPGAEAFTIMIPPPNVTGSLHIGHAFNNTLQDILVRWKRMQGYDTLWQPGQDHAGIATQMVVERELAAEGKTTRKEMGRDAFVKRVWEQKAKSGNIIIDQLKRIGSSCDWSRNAFTMSGAPGAPSGEEGNFHDAVLKVFVDMYNKGTIYKGNRLVNWDPKFETAISDLEVENIEVDGHMWHFKYPLADGETYEYVEKDEDGNVTLRETRDYISIATTRPETMLGDGAVAVHPSDERYKPIVGKMVHLPLCDRLIPIITDEYPDPDFGSGAVKITGAHDFNDYAVAKRNDIPMYPLMDTTGHMVTGDIVPEAYRGMDRFECRKAVVEDITALGLAVMVLEMVGESPTLQDVDRRVGGSAPAGSPTAPHMIPYVENKKIMQPFGDRSKVVIEPMLTDQWYVDTKQIVQPAIDAVKSGEVTIMPESDRKVYFHWLENIEPWCISRQLWWGHQIPVWYGPDGKEFCAATFEEAAVNAKSHYVWSGEVRESELDPHYFDEKGQKTEALPGIGIHSNIMGENPNAGQAYLILDRDPDVLDTWFSSGLWPIGTLGWPEETPEFQKYFPTSVLITGFDIIFFWVARMIMMQLAVTDKIPFHTVYVHALVRDEKGKKMSKSTGNVIDPLEMIDEFGADALRFTLSAMGRDLKLSTARLTGYRNFGTKLWNAARFAEMNECKPSADFDPLSVTQTVNKWIVGETARALQTTNKALESYRFSDAAMGLYAHVWGKVCDWYVEFAKPMFKSDDPAVVAETRATMAWAIDQCLIMLHPIMPFITEQLWGDIAPRQKMLVHTDWPEYGDSLINPAADAEMGWVIDLIDAIRSVRAEMRVPAGAKIPMVQLDLSDAGKAALQGNSLLIHRLARVSDISLADEAPKGAVTITVEGGTFCLPLADVIDLDAEKARLTKALEKLVKEAGGIKGKLANEKFVSKAPAAVVEENRARLVVLDEEVKNLNTAMQRLADLG
ncbi:MAG: valine--tRNA ligase [Rhodobacteraceae bacterium]|nr:valine--tRNA ligase [Paracoccaceae bacterium]